MGGVHDSTPVAVVTGLLTLAEFHSVDEVDQQFIERMVTQLLEQHGQAFLDRERDEIRSNAAFFLGVWLEEYGEQGEVDGWAPGE